MSKDISRRTFLERAVESLPASILGGTAGYFIGRGELTLQDVIKVVEQLGFRKDMVHVVHGDTTAMYVYAAGVSRINDMVDAIKKGALTPEKRDQITQAVDDYNLRMSQILGSEPNSEPDKNESGRKRA